MIRRFCSTLPPSTSKKARESIFRRILAAYAEQQDSAFSEQRVQRMHEHDGVNREKWALIYRDVDGTRSQFFTGVGIPVVLGVAALGIYDFTMHEEEDRMSFYKRITDDAEELGIFAVIPLALGLAVVSILARLHTLRVYRIYQNKSVPDEYLAILPKMGLRQMKMPFTRETACTTMPEELQDLTRIAVASSLGNVVLGNRRVLLQDDAFRVNSMRSYMLNESSRPPRLDGF
uniref:Transmembrane protein n=1 Tax=Steinernema glaseri TaxID=37863 RepID=A0A1I7Y409_9BILA